MKEKYILVANTIEAIIVRSNERTDVRSYPALLFRKLKTIVDSHEFMYVNCIDRPS
jgi:hypothetical protein